jgi:restriction endonuclease S subunit
MDKSKWEYKKLGEICVLLNGYAFKSEKYVDEGIRVMRITNVQKGAIVDDDPKFYPMSSQTEIQRYLLKENDLLVSLTGNVGRVGLLQSELLPAALNQRVACLRQKNNSLDLRYLFHLLNSDLFEKDCIANSQGIAQKNMSTKWLSDYELPIPPIGDQQRIVAELDCLNEMIAVKQEQLKEFDKLAQSIFYDMFGKLDAPQHTLKDVLSKMGSGATPSGGNQSYKTEGTSLIRSLNVHNNEFIYTDLAFIDDEQARKLDNVIIEENDVLLNITGASVARCCIVPSDVLPARVNQHVTILRTKSNLINSTYLCHLLISKEEQTKLIALSKSKAATREALPKNILEKYLIPLPPLELQQQFADKISAIEAQKELVKQSIAETQTLLDYTMDYYFN